MSKAKARSLNTWLPRKKQSRPSLKIAEKLEQLPWRLSTSAEQVAVPVDAGPKAAHTHTHAPYVTTQRHVAPSHADTLTKAIFFGTSKSVEMLDFSVGRLFSLALLFVQISWNAAILNGANFFLGGVGGGTVNAQNRKGQGSAQGRSVSVSFSRSPKSSQVGMQNGARPMLTLPALLRIVCKK